MNYRKDQILAEIRRIAEKQGGRAPGKNQFFNETGIKESDWSGRYWSRWGDAVAEAGFQPNTLQPRLDDNFMLAKLADLTRNLGRFPTVADLRLRTRKDPDFPSDKTFSRFGDKASWPARLAKFCENSPSADYADVADICRREGERIRANASDAGDDIGSEDEETGRAVEAGVVYLLRAGRHYKIGRTNSSDRRERELAIQLPERAARVHEIHTDDASGIEAYWHRRFADRRKNGEWFALTSSDVKAFKRRKFM